MNQDPLQQFARRLHAWSTDELQKKSGPFRTVELFPDLLTTTGNIAPPVVVWVNRESHLAGGVILLPKKDPTDVLDSGREICAALGLDYYYTWARNEVSAWRVGKHPGRQWSELLPSTAKLEESTFREVLAHLLEHMQNQFFINQLHLPRLSAPYLTNLLHSCIESTLPLILSPDRSKESGRHSLAGVILQMLALYSQSSLPSGTGPNKLLVDLKCAAKHLPAVMANALTQHDDTTNLPESAAIKLHHLYQRLQQHDLELVEFIPETVHRLLRFWSETDGLFPLPAAIKKTSSTLIIAPDRYQPEMSISIEVAAPPLCAATALLRRLQSPVRRHPLQFSDLLELRSPIEIDTVIGTLDDRSRATALEQKSLNALLRYSWPNRHLKLARTAPQWTWRVIHLVGLLPDTTEFTLHLPADWLWAPYGEQFFVLLSECVALGRIGQSSENQVRVEFNRSTRSQVVVDSFAAESRLLDNQNKDLTRVDLLLALSLPTTIYDLVRNGELQATKDTVMSTDAIELFLRSSIGRSLWQILAPKTPLPGRLKLATEITRTGLPLPSEQALNALSRLTRKYTQPDTATIDRELEIWLGSACMSVFTPCFRSTVKTTTAPPETGSAEVIAASLIQAGELRSFPQDYLYNTPEDARKTYSIDGSLSIGETFFNLVTLIPPTGTPIQIEGVTTARALQLISTVQHGEVALPADEQQVRLILERYLDDLQNLQNRLLQTITDSGQIVTASLAEQIWELLPVPPRYILDHR